MTRTIFLYPAVEQRPIKDVAAAVRRLRGRCKATWSSDGSIMLTGPDEVLTQEFLLGTMAYVEALWTEMKREEGASHLGDGASGQTVA